MTDSVHEKWENFLNPDVMRPTLIMTSLYVTAFEILKDTIISRVRDIYHTGWRDGVDLFSSNYKAKVLSRSTSTVHASLNWLQQAGAVDQADIEGFKATKDLRNRLVHNLQRLLNDGLPEEFPAQFGQLITLLRKIELWFLMEVEIPTNPDFDGKDVDPNEVQPGSILILQILLEVSLGDKTSRNYFDEFTKRSPQPIEGTKIPQ